MSKRSFRENWSLLTPGQKVAIIGGAIWAMFKTAVGATGDGNTSWSALKTLDKISDNLKKDKRNHEQVTEILEKALDTREKN